MKVLYYTPRKWVWSCLLVIFFYGLCVPLSAQSILGNQLVNPGEQDTYYLFDQNGNQTSICGTGQSYWTVVYSNGTSATTTALNNVSNVTVTWASTANNSTTATITFNGYITEPGGCVATGPLTFEVSLAGTSIAGDNAPVSLGESYGYSLMDYSGSSATLCNGAGAWSVSKSADGLAGAAAIINYGNTASITFSNTSQSTEVVTVNFIGSILISSVCMPCTVSYNVTVPSSLSNGRTTGGSTCSSYNYSTGCVGAGCPPTCGPTASSGFGPGVSLSGGGTYAIGGETVKLTGYCFWDVFVGNCPTFQWQKSTDCGNTWQNIGGKFSLPLNNPSWTPILNVPVTQCGVTYYQLAGTFIEGNPSLCWVPFWGPLLGTTYSFTTHYVTVVGGGYGQNNVIAPCGAYSGTSEVGADAVLTVAGSSSNCSNGVTLPAGTTTLMKAGTDIYLGPGFVANAGSKLYAEIAVPCANGNGSAFRQAAPATIAPAPSINQVIAKEPDATSANSKVSIYPNPTTGIVNISFSYAQSQSVQIKVLNMIGEQIYSGSLGNIQTGQSSVDLSAEPAGIYIVQVTSGSNVSTQKVILEK